MLTKQLVFLLLLVQLSTVLSIPVDLTNRTDMGGLVQDQHINLDWLGTLLKGFGPVLVPQPTSPVDSSVVQSKDQSDGRADAIVQRVGQSDTSVDTKDQTIGQSGDRDDAIIMEVDQSGNRAATLVKDDVQSESRAEDVRRGVPKEESLTRNRLSIGSDFLEALLSDEAEGIKNSKKGSSNPVHLREEAEESKNRVELEPSFDITENYGAEMDRLVANPAEAFEKGPETTKWDKPLDSGEDKDRVDAESEVTDPTDVNDEDGIVLRTESPVNVLSGEGIYEYPYGNWEDPWDDWGWPVFPTEVPDTTPEQIHISWGNYSNQMVVVWSAKSYGTGMVHYGIAPENYTQEVSADYHYFWYGNNEGLQHIYRAVLTGLIPGRNYSYKVQCGEDESPGFQFTAKMDSVDWSPELLVYGDMGRVGGAPSLARLKQEAGTGKYTAVLHVGDFAYDLHTEGGKYGDDFMNRIQDIAAKLPYMTCPGNHELTTEKETECVGPAMGGWSYGGTGEREIEFDFNPYLTRFSMPQSPWPGNMDKMWYSFNLGRAHFISYSSEVFFTDSPEEEQHKWLVSDLTEANSPENRTLHPWIIAFGHRPMYCSNVDGDDCTKEKSRVRTGLEDLLYQYGVDIIIEAHEHSYERLWPVYNYTVFGKDYRDPRAPIHIISGAAGCNEFDGVCINPMMGPRGPWSAYRAWIPGLYGYGRLRVQNSTHVHWEQILAVNGQSIDSAWIVQHHHRPFGEEQTKNIQDKSFEL